MWLWTVLIVFRRGAFRRHELEADGQEVLADDVQARIGQEMVDVGDAAGDRILDRDHGEIGRALLDRGEAILEGRAGNRLGLGIDLAGRDLGIGAGLALENDRFFGLWPSHRLHPFFGAWLSARTGKREALSAASRWRPTWPWNGQVAPGASGTVNRKLVPLLRSGTIVKERP